MQREVLDPLGMRRTTARISTIDPERIALPHALRPEPGWRRVPLAKGDANSHAAGGHFTTAQDLARFVAAHASGGLIAGQRVFPRDVTESMKGQRGCVRVPRGGESRGGGHDRW